MIEVLVSWMIILIASFLFGYIIIKIILGETGALFGLDVIIMCGLMMLNVFAEFFSIFYKVGMMACFVLTLLGGCVLLYILYTKSMNQLLKLFKTLWNKSYIVYISVFFCTLAMLLWTALTPQHYDTSLYHAQAVRWIEEYGVVPGLGNLHNRFAYNSAFMPLQALFSLKWLFGQSLHTLNGFICYILLLYSVITNNLIKGEKLRLSDFLKFSVIIYICVNRSYISSLSSDILAMLGITYILIKWSELNEKQVKDETPYCFLCVMCVWMATVKLSIATGVLLVVYPLILLIQKRKWKKIAAYLCLGFLIAIPWLIRNVIISGYLIYPYSKVDFFNFDWKMLPSILDYDKMEIVVWGRNVKQVELYYQPVYTWIAEWYKAQSLFDQGLIILGGISVPIVLGICLKKSHEKNYADFMLCFVSLVGLITWFFSAPLLRYGEIYLLLTIAIVAEKIYAKYQTIIKTAYLLVIILEMIMYMNQITCLNVGGIVEQEDYDYCYYPTYEAELDGIKIWIPEQGDQAGYSVFPSTPYAQVLNIIELRGNDLQDGFKVKEEYQELRLNAYGSAWE